jgi:holliday junction DNA helicase RuvA
MFAKLTGTIDDIAEDHLILDCGGVGYLVFASSRTLDGLRSGETLSLRIETHVGEDHIRLYGFRAGEEQRWFKLLQSVQGVGARVALAILSVLPPERLAAAIAAQDKASVAQANGVGPKLAQRIVTELKDKAGALSVATITSALGGNASKASGILGDAMSALTNLGYPPAAAHRAVSAAITKLGEEAALGSVIKVALQEAANG